MAQIDADVERLGIGVPTFPFLERGQWRLGSTPKIVKIGTIPTHFISVKMIHGIEFEADHRALCDARAVSDLMNLMNARPTIEAAHLKRLIV